jgi:hypothetical protein
MYIVVLWSGMQPSYLVYTVLGPFLAAKSTVDGRSLCATNPRIPHRLHGELRYCNEGDLCARTMWIANGDRRGKLLLGGIITPSYYNDDLSDISLETKFIGRTWCRSRTGRTPASSGGVLSDEPPFHGPQEPHTLCRRFANTVAHQMLYILVFWTWMCRYFRLWIDILN